MRPHRSTDGITPTKPIVLGPWDTHVEAGLQTRRARTKGSVQGPRPKDQGLMKTLPLPIVALLALATATVLAHDPGLSTLDVVVDGRAVSATLSMSAQDVALAVQTL